MSNKLIVLPTNRAIRERVKLIEKNSFIPKMITIDDFMKRVIDLNGKEYITDSDKKILLLQEACNFENFKNLNIEYEFFSFIKQSHFIMRFFEELSLEQINIEELNLADTYAEYQEHLDILNTILINYKKSLNSENLVDKTNIVENHSINHQTLSMFEEVEIEIEGYLTKFEIDLIKELAKKINIKIILYANKFNSKVIDTFRSDSYNLDIGHKFKIDLKNSIIEQKNPLKNSNNINVTAFSNRILQIAFIKSKIFKYIKKHNIDPKNIGVIVPDESFIKYIKTFDSEKYFNFAMGSSYTTTKTFKILDSIKTYINKPNNISKSRLEILNIDYEFVTKIIKKNWLKIYTYENLKELLEKIKNQFEIKNDEIFDEEIYRLLILYKKIKPIKLSNIYQIFINRLKEKSIDDVQGGKITVLGALESRNIKFDLTIIVDFNEDIVPKRNIKDKFISSNVRKHANLPTSLDRENLQKFLYQRVLENSKYVEISYVDNKESYPSRFLKELGLEIDRQVEDSKYMHIIKDKNSFIKYLDRDINIDIDLTQRVWSASSLQRFFSCKRKFYLQDILQIKEHKISKDVSPLDIGNHIHHTLFQLYKDRAFFTDKRDMTNIIKNIIEKNSSNSYYKFYTTLWKRILDKFCDTEMRRFQEGVQVESIESSFNFQYRGINLKGRIDRVDIDKYGKKTIIDYKTGKTELPKLKNLENSSDFQLVIYFLNYRDSNPNIALYDLKNSKLLVQDRDTLQEHINIFDNRLKELNQTNVSFGKCEDKKVCIYCPYNIICGVNL